ncbi:putative Glycosyltransferase [Nostocoides japonicum T1-X7]|uniref:D-inositol 3-phosphate glycosyltransferase n=1 Tax=Nostocoides japonicum T1-X7 TaxID=1194083 RepID=A0A077M0D5_9MICO|nr:glycosyltransferase [Tetrasphaera japonica]CCH79723.1 putative Glycosyltransferase [Tetrasphaera japonica T1-X7]
MPARPRRLALVSMHTSPTDTPGTGDAGGMNVYLASVAGPLVAEGFSVDLVTRRVGPEQPAVEELPSGARLVRIEAGPPEDLSKGRLEHHVEEFAAGLADVAAYDLVHSHYWLSGVAGLAVARALGVPHVLSLHTVAALKNATLAPGDEPEPHRRLRWERDLARASAATVAATRAEARAICEYYGIDPAEVDVVTPGVDHAVFTPSGPGPTGAAGDLLAQGRPYLLVAARMQPLKGQDVAVEALARLDPVTRPALVLTGEASPGHEAYRERVLRRVRELGLTQDVVTVSAVPRPELAALFRGATLLLVPSRSETFGLVTVEAAASGLPTVAARVGGLAEAVSDGVSGILVDGHDPGAWAAAIEDLLADPVRYAALSATALGYAAEFSWTAVAARLAARYRSLVGAS